MADDLSPLCRAQFPLCATTAYLNNAGVAPTSLAVQAAVNRWLDDLTHHGLHHESGWEAEAERVRGLAATLLGASPNEVAFVRNTSHGLALVAEGLDWRPGDEVAICPAVEYPSNLYPWQHLAGRGVTVRTIEAVRGGVTPNAVAAALTPRTRLVSVSAVQFATGHRTDLGALGNLCHERGLLLCVDGIQQLGAFPLDVKALGVHFLAADSHKWLLGVCGIGVLFVDEAVLPRLRPALVGWKSTTDAWSFERPLFALRPDARKLEEGSPAYALVYGLGAALELIAGLGVPRIEAHIRMRLAELEQAAGTRGWGVSPAPKERAGIALLGDSGDPAALAAGCASRGVSVSVRSGRLRVSPHAFNDAEDIERLVAALAELHRVSARAASPGR